MMSSFDLAKIGQLTAGLHSMVTVHVCSSGIDYNIHNDNIDTVMQFDVIT